MNKIQQLKEYDEQYYNEGTSPLSDDEYDELKEDAKEEFPNDPYFDDVGAPIKKEKKVKLPYILGSLKKEKINTIEKKMKDNEGPYMYSEKIDGVSIFVRYVEGEVTEAYTRGNGEYGQDITDKAKIFCPTIKNSSEIIVRGDAVLLDKHQFKNRRNGAAGILNRDDTKQADLLIPVFYECIKYHELELTSEYEEFVLMESLELPICKWKQVETFDLLELLDFYKNMGSAVYETDGVVISIDKNTRENVLFPKNKIAFKLQKNGIKSQVEKIEWNVSRGGRVVPTIIIQPIEINGSTVSRTTGFNAQYIEQKNIGIGTTLELVKSGDVIPYIIGIDTNGTMVPEIPEYCPSCNSFLEWKGVDLICKNVAECGDIAYKSVEYFIRTLGAENITEKTLRKLDIKNIDRLYEIRETEIAKIDGFGDKKAEQFVSEVKRTLNNTHSNLLAAFGIPGVGSVIAKNLIKCFETIDNVLEADEEKLMECDGVGPKIANNIWVESTLCNITYDNLKRFGLNLRSSEKGTLDGKTITLTGKGPLGRKEIQELIEINGGIMKGISKSTDILVTDDVNSQTTKMEKARKYGVNIMSYEEFMREL